MASINSTKHTITASLSKKLDIIAPVRHTDLLGLDYEHSGHTGFASTRQLNEQIERIDEQIESLSKIKGLPEVTSEDAGKFLRVNTEGKWVAESVPLAEEQEGF